MAKIKLIVAYYNNKSFLDVIDLFENIDITICNKSDDPVYISQCNNNNIEVIHLENIGREG